MPRVWTGNSFTKSICSATKAKRRIANFNVGWNVCSLRISHPERIHTFLQPCRFARLRSIVPCDGNYAILSDLEPCITSVIGAGSQRRVVDPLRLSHLSDRFAAFLSCIVFEFYAAFNWSMPAAYAASGVCRSSAEFGQSELYSAILFLMTLRSVKPSWISTRQMASCFGLRQSRSMKTLSRYRPRPYIIGKCLHANTERHWDAYPSLGQRGDPRRSCELRSFISIAYLRRAVRDDCLLQRLNRCSAGDVHSKSGERGRSPDASCVTAARLAPCAWLNP